MVPLEGRTSCANVYLGVFDYGNAGLEGVYVEKKVFWGADEEPVHFFSGDGFCESPELYDLCWEHRG